MANIMSKKISLKAKERKENRWLDLTSLIVNQIQWEEDMAFCTLNSYKNECFEDESKILYGLDETGIWDNLFKISNTKDYDDLHKKFKSAKWCKHENLMMFELLNGAKFCALRL